ncbi:MAG: hypothetical protein HC853_07090 [Anaerolineae bacterium]|nr:hypothetical protein [Anaerolineae bacterium]
MCIIVDANMASIVFARPAQDDFVPLIDWLTSQKHDGRLVIGGKLSEELNRVANFGRFIQTLSRAGRARQISSKEVEEETSRVESMNLCRSDDPHVIALARVSGARTLCTAEVKLHADFKNQKLISNPRGRIYQTSDHKNLLRHESSCRMKMHTESKAM